MPTDSIPPTATEKPTVSTRAAHYCCTASASEEAARASLLQQAHGLRCYAIVGEYHGVGYTGGAQERPALAELYADLDAGRIDVVLVTALGRLARPGSVLRILERFDATGARLVSVGDRCDSATVEGCAMLAALLEAQGIA